MSRPEREVLLVEGLSKRLGRRPLVQDIGFRVLAGELVAVTGENGSGKSTLLRLLSGQLQPDTGTISVEGAQVGALRNDGRRHLAYVPDTSEAFLDLGAMEFVELMRSLRGVTPSSADKVWEERLGLLDWAARPLRVLSFGQRKRTWLAAALTASPPLLLVDEPTNGLDAQAIDLVTELFHERQQECRATLITTNDPLALERWLPSVYRLHDGRGSWISDGARGG